MVTATRLRDAIDEILPGVIADRRHLHENPELGYQEVETSRFVAERLQALGVEDVRTGIAQTGVTGLIRGTAGAPGAGKVVLVRADMDALPILEENDVEYRSTKNGTMHACGHDAHTAMLLGVARVLLDRRDAFGGTVKLLFQPSEELPPGGAKPMIEAGVLEDPAVDAVFGMHVSQDQERGTIGLRSGPAMAAADRFVINIKGRGGHGARPHACIDPIAIGAQIVTALQTIVSREIDPVQPAVVSTCAFLAGEAFNVIPDTAELRGTVRSFDPDVRLQLATRIEELVRGVGEAMRAEIEVTYTFGYPPTVNDPEMTELVRAVATETVGAERVLDVDLKMGAEDFSYFLEERPGCFFFVGTRNEERGLIWGHHHPRFDIDEEAMGAGIETMASTLLRYLDRAG
ncbi:MAG: M20 family metallopeptidase [Chloroflexota bacterium]|nr:M20 family metallopeptidase [Chloroflexota bacterium]